MMPNNTTQNTDDKKKTLNDSLDDKLYEHNFMFSSLRECHVFFLIFFRSCFISQEKSV